MAIHRELTFEDYVAILRRRRWLLIIPAILGAAAAGGADFGGVDAGKD